MRFQCEVTKQYQKELIQVLQNFDKTDLANDALSSQLVARYLALEDENTVFGYSIFTPTRGELVSQKEFIALIKLLSL